MQVARRYETRGAGDDELIGREIQREVEASGPASAGIDVLLVGGDGTTHDVLQGLLASESHSARLGIRLILVPAGTANALYAAIYPPETSKRHRKDPHDKDSEHAWRLRSLRSYLRGGVHDDDDDHNTGAGANLYPLTIQRTMLFLPYAKGEIHTRTHIVTSHALHAAILHDSEALRSTHPGIERFKIASAQNAVRWVEGQLTLREREAHGVQVFDSRERRFVPCGDKVLRGPFWYMICPTVDRLEPSFVPAPFSSPSAKGQHDELARPPDVLDLVLIRPLRDPIVQRHLRGDHARDAAATAWDDETSRPAREAFAKARAAQLTAAMYAEGRHVYLRYPCGGDGVDDEQLTEDGEGETVVEYYRCAGYEWCPAPASERAGLTCMDGTVVQAERTEVFVDGDAGSARRVSVWM